jgi:transcriptional antiterminator RfaH
MLESDELPRGDLRTAKVDAWQSESRSDCAIAPYNGINPSMTFAWYALNTKPRKEEFLSEQCLAHGYETFYPCLRVQPVNPRARKIRPYFPGYLFVHVDLERVNLSTLRWMPGAARLVSFDGIPATVPEGLIHAIQRRVEEVNAAGGELFDGLKSGDVIYIQDGPFAGYEAIFDARLPGSERVRVLLKLLQKRQMPVDLPAGQIWRKNHR